MLARKLRADLCLNKHTDTIYNQDSLVPTAKPIYGSLSLSTPMKTVTGTTNIHIL